MARHAMSIFFAVLGVIFLFLSGGIAYASTQTFVETSKRESRSSSETLFDEDFDVEGVDYEHFDFTLDKGVEVTVKWEWAVDGDEVINWYLLKEEEFEQWENDEGFSYIVNAKNTNDDSGEVALKDGDYVFLFNNAENDDTVSLSFEATMEWDVEVVVKSSRNLVNEWLPYVFACEVLSLLSFLGSVLSFVGESRRSASQL